MVGCRRDGSGMRLYHPQVTARAEEKVQRFSCFSSPKPSCSLLRCAVEEDPVMVGSTFSSQPGCRDHGDEGKQGGAAPGPRARPWPCRDPQGEPVRFEVVKIPGASFIPSQNIWSWAEKPSQHCFTLPAFPSSSARALRCRGCLGGRWHPAVPCHQLRSPRCSTAGGG